VVDTAKMRRPTFASADEHPTGHVAHDDRGNAVWTWSEDIASEPLRYATGIEISDETGDSRIESMNTGQYVQVVGKGGYNPYEKGPVQLKPEAPRKRDLRALSKWIEERRQRGEPTKV
jgi:hypothetical protein